MAYSGSIRPSIRSNISPTHCTGILIESLTREKIETTPLPSDRLYRGYHTLGFWFSGRVTKGPLTLLSQRRTKQSQSRPSRSAFRRIQGLAARRSKIEGPDSNDESLISQKSTQTQPHLVGKRFAKNATPITFACIHSMGMLTHFTS